MQFENYLVNIFNIFNQKYKIPSVQSSVDFIRSELITNNLNTEQMEEFKSTNQVKRDKEFENFRKSSDVDQNSENLLNDNQLNTSPFKIYFKTMIDEFKSFLIHELESECLEENKYFCPEIFDIISNYLHLVGLWSGVVIIHLYYIYKFIIFVF